MLPLFLVQYADSSAIGYDCARGFLVAANTPDEARRLASLRSGDEGDYYWLNPDQSVCVRIAPSSRYDDPQVLLRDFHNG